MFASFLLELHAVRLSDTTPISLGLNVSMSDPLNMWITARMCEAVRYGSFISRWLIAPLPPPGVRGGSGTGSELSKLCDRARRD